MGYASARDAADAFVSSEPSVASFDYTRPRVQSSLRVITTPPRAHVRAVLTRMYQAVGVEVARWPTGGVALFAAYVAWRLDASRATPSFAELARAHNRVADPELRCSKATMRRRLMRVDEAVERELERRRMFREQRTGDRRDNRVGEA